MKRNHLVVSPEVGKLIDDEVVRRNKELPIGDRVHTKRSVSEEAVTYWAKRNESIINFKNQKRMEIENETLYYN
jgi:hypothetical protein